MNDFDTWASGGFTVACEECGERFIITAAEAEEVGKSGEDFLCPACRTAKAAAEFPQRKFEYELCSWDTAELKTMLNDMGAEGWELVSEMTGVCFIFKREVFSA